WQAGAITTATAVAVTYLTSFTDPVTTTLTALLIGGAISSPATATTPRLRHWFSAALAATLGVFLGGTALVAEAMYSAGATAPHNTTTLMAATAVRPWDPDLARRIGYTLTRLAERQQAAARSGRDLLEATCPSLPGSVECLHSLADAQDLNGDPTSALSTLDDALLLEPTNVDTHLKRGIALANLARYAEAEAAFRHAADLRPTAPEPWRNLSLLYRLQGRSEDAESAQTRANELTPRR
ncbi:MAG: hypothetical protein WCF12_01235, partial [Propionicimonas sp.]